MTQPLAIRLPRRERVTDGWPVTAAVFAVTGGIVALAIVLRWYGTDMSAQIFRADLVRRDGFVLWNNQWFGGHATLVYSVLSPLIAALTGPTALGAASCVIGAVLFERILRYEFGRGMWIGALWFATGAATNLIMGRVTFSLGVALALASVAAMQRSHPRLAVVFAILCPLASPVAGVFLAIGACAWGLARPAHRIAAAAVAAGALVPIAVLALLFPSPGTEPFELWALGFDLGVCAIVAVVAHGRPALRWGAGLYALAAVFAYVVPSAMGGNVNRLAQGVGGPLLACLLLPRRKLLVAVLAIPLLISQSWDAIDAIAYAPRDLSTHASYYTGVVSYLEQHQQVIGRVEIPFTYRHWEAAYVAPKVMLARGWERQLDIAYDPIFYSKPLTPASYHEWLTENGVAYVALPDVRLDDSSLGERALLERGVSYLVPVWRDAHWRVWQVKDFEGLVQGGASLRTMTPDTLTLRVQRPGAIKVRVRASSHWSVPAPACVTSTADGWLVVDHAPRGLLEVKQALRGSRCPGAD
ncbi:MAG TPA: hypothetical protein VFR41_10450 [Acidimicrobiia bacterium]|nr:hypothetical protein [Acidimicrobiia bacterium]